MISRTDLTVADTDTSVHFSLLLREFC